MADHEENIEVLTGGVNEVRRVGSTVVRLTGPQSTAVQALLRYVRERGFAGCPEVISIDHDRGTETLTFLQGETTNYPLREAFRSDRALGSAARLLRSYHDATLGFPSADLTWLLSPRSPVEVVCHGDFAPYNCVVVDGEVTGVFDFDTAHPGSRLWDIGYGAYRWAPLAGPSNPYGLGDIAEQSRRLRMFCDVYGTEDLAGAVAAAQERLGELVRMMRKWAASGNEAFARHIAEGHDILYVNDIEYLADASTRLTRNN